MQFAGWLVVILVASLLPSQAPAADIPTERDVTFFVMSDPHIGFQDKNQPTRSTDEIIGDGRRQVERIAGIIGTPYPDRSPLASLKPGNVATPRALLIAGDLTDNQRWDAFTAVFPPAGIRTATGSIPILLCVGNHDGDPGGPVRRGAVDSNRAHQRAGRLAAISEDGMHYAVNWDGLHVLCLGLCPADTVDADLPFKYGKPGPGSWNDPKQALAFLKKYLREHIGTSGQPVVLMHHYGFDGFSTNDWYWWTPQQRRAYYDALAGYNVVAILHGHDHHAAHYRWPNPEASVEEARRQFGDNPPPDPRTYDVFSCGSLCWVFRVTGDRFVAAHYGGHGTGWDTELVMVKPLTSREISVNDGRPSCTPQKSTAAKLQPCSSPVKTEREPDRELLPQIDCCCLCER